MATTVKFGVIKGLSLTTPCVMDPKCARRGWAMDVALLICEILHWHCTFEQFNSNAYGDVDDNGTASGMVAAIKDGIYDTSPPVYAPTYRRMKAIDFAKIYFNFDGALVTRTLKNRVTSGIDWSLLRAFHWSVWLSFSALLLLCAVLNALSTIKDSKYGPLNTLFDWTVRLVKYDTEPSLLQPLHIRTSYGAWILGGLVLTSSYTGMLFSEKLIQNSDVPFTDLESFVSCLERGQCRLVTHTESITYYLQLTLPGTEITDRVQKALQTFPTVIIPEGQILQAILNEDRYYLVWHWPKDLVYYHIDGNRDCAYYLVNSRFSEQLTFPVQKNSTLLKSLDRLAYVLTENRIHYNMRGKYFRPAECGTERSMNAGRAGLGSIPTAVYFYAVGMGMAGMTIVAELLVWKWVKRR